MASAQQQLLLLEQCFRHSCDVNECQCSDVGDVNLSQLPTDTLLIIFALCGPNVWPVLSQVCHRFNAILGPNSFLWDKISRKLIIVNQLSSTFKSRLFVSLPARDRFRVYKNWRKGACSWKSVHVIPDKHILPWVVQKSDKIWVGMGNHIKAIARSPSAVMYTTSGVANQFSHRTNSSMFKQLQTTSYNGDFGRFIVQDGIVVAGDTFGSLSVWQESTGRLLLRQTRCHDSEISVVALFKQLLVSGGLDRACKIWQNNGPNIFLHREINLQDRILSLDIDPSGSNLCTGSGGHNDIPPSHLFDLETGAMICALRKQFRDGEGVYDVHFESPNQLLTGDFNSALRLWDIRTQRNVATWDDPHDSAVNCIASDDNMTMLTGTATHGGIRLWDKRQRGCVQLYFARPDFRSPVYGLDFDSSEMYVALDKSILGFDFSGSHQNTLSGLTVYSCQ